MCVVCRCCCGLLSVISPPFDRSDFYSAQRRVDLSCTCFGNGKQVAFGIFEGEISAVDQMKMLTSLGGENDQANRLVLQPWPTFSSSSSSDEIHDLEFNVHVDDQHSAQPDYKQTRFIVIFVFAQAKRKRERFHSYRSRE